VVTSGKGQVAPASKGYASAKATTLPSELAFLRDASLAPEEKLLLLLAYQKKKVNAEIDALLKKAEPPTAAKKKSGGFLGVLKSAIPALGMADKLLGGKLESLIKQVSGPALAAAATAAGFPMLAPFALSLAPQLAGALLEAEVPAALAEAVGGSATSSSSAKTSATSAGKLDETDVARLNLLRDRASEWATLVSNLLQSMHQTRMNLIQNLR
jgi:hypothetical protein